jgi:hypothetical protein
MVLDDIMEILEKVSPKGIQWRINKQLMDIDYADNVCVLTDQKTCKKSYKY